MIIISILGFSLFGSDDYRSEFRLLEVSRSEMLSDKLAMYFFEVSKIPQRIDMNNELELMLSLFRAKTEEELKQLEDLEVPFVTEAIGAYRDIIRSTDFREMERLRADARHNEASAIANAERKEAARWEGIVANKDAEIAGKDAEIERLRALLGDGNN